MGETPLAVDASGLCRRYGRRWALIDVSLQIPAGAIVMVTGRNGSGKSTLLRVLSTAIRADRGTARVAGFDIRTAAHDLRGRVALLSHHTHLYEALSALENLRVVARFLGRASSREALLPLLDEVGLSLRADDEVATFSAGMRKRLTLARTLLQEASVVFLDEPYGQLDPPGFRLVDSLLERWRNRGTTVLMATHLLERGSTLCDLGVVLEEGRRQWFGPAAELPRGDGANAAGPPEGD